MGGRSATPLELVTGGGGGGAQEQLGKFRRCGGGSACVGGSVWRGLGRRAREGAAQAPLPLRGRPAGPPPAAGAAPLARTQGGGVSCGALRPLPTSERLLEGVAEAAQLLVADAAGRPEEAGDEARSRGDLRLHGPSQLARSVLPSPPPSLAALPGAPRCGREGRRLPAAPAEGVREGRL